ncbi:response regulator [Rickettsiales bacterium]|nr:response regulator [Rickettsiales bacterium]
MTNQKTKILCAEDEVDIRENIVDILQDEGFEVIAAADGADAFEILSQNSDIGLVVSDIMMPNISGLELLSKVRESKTKYCNIPFILLTALSTKEDLIKGSNMGANDYIVKPIDFDILIAKIKEKLSNATMVASQFNNRVKNITEQISNILPNNIMENIKIINHLSEILRSEPYGPFPHQKYLIDLNRIYTASLKLTALTNNYLEVGHVNNIIDENAEIHDPVKLLNDIVSSLSSKLKEYIHVNIENTRIPKVKIDPNIIIESIKKTLSVLLKAHLVNIDINIIFDHLDRVVFVLTIRDYIEKDNISKVIEEKGIDQKLRESEYDFDIIFNNGEFSALIFIPTFKIVQ